MLPTSVSDALAIAHEAAPRVVAGCTDFFPSQGRGARCENILDITRVAELRGIHATGAGWRIGAAATWSEIVRAPLPPAFDGLKLAAREVGAVQIQNRGTLVGNICNASPAADGVPPLLTLGAEVEIMSVHGMRTVPLARFILGPRKVDLAAGEIVSAIIVPAPGAGARGGFIKLGSRRHLVISIVMVAVLAEIEEGRVADLRIAAGSCAPVAARLPALEARFTGMSRDELAAPDLGARDLGTDDLGADDLGAGGALAPLSPITDVRGTAAYRRAVVAELSRRAVLQAGGEW